MNYNIIANDDLDKFAQLFFKSRSNQRTTDHGKLYALINAARNRYETAEEKDKDEFKLMLVEYIESYSFITQVISYDDIKLEKLFVFAKFIANLLPRIRLQIPELKGDVLLQDYRLKITYEGDISVRGGERPLVGRDHISIPRTPDVLTTLSEVIQTINEKFRGDVRISSDDRIALKRWLENLEKDSELIQIAKANEFEDFIRIYKKKFREQMLVSLSDNRYLVTIILTDAKLEEEIIIKAATFHHKWANANNLPPITPGTPAENRLLFRQTIQKCKGFLHWIDLYIGKDGLEFLVDSFDRQNIKEIKILTSLYNNDYQINRELRDQFERFQKEMEQKGISFEMRLISTKDAYDRVAHDRFIIGENIKYNVPSFTTIIKGRLSEIKPTTNDIPFIDYWNDIDSLDISRDWIKIRDILDKTMKRTYDAICSKCKKETRVPFKPDGRGPVYCRECRSKN